MAKANKGNSKYKLQNKATFLRAWLIADKGNDDLTYEIFVSAIREEFDKMNTGHTRTDDQVGSSIILKARSIKKELLEMGKGCPAVPMKKGKSDIVSVEQALKDKSLSDMLEEYK